MIRRTPIRRRLYRPPPRRDEDKVSPDDYAYVMLRDGSCVARQIDPDHHCQGHATLDHVPGKNQNAMGRRSPSDRKHLVRLCLSANIDGWASAHRDAEREYLARVEPDE